MFTEVHCPQCRNVIIKQIEPVNGRIQLTCAHCRTNVLLTFQDGILTTLMYKETGGSRND